MKISIIKYGSNVLRDFMGCVLIVILLISVSSCNEELPGVGSIEDRTPPKASFSYIPDANDFTLLLFSNESISATDFQWDFGGGNTSTEKNPSYQFTAGEGVYPVSLTASDANGATSTVTIDVEVIDLFVAIEPDILNGDFNDGQDDWKFSSFSGGTTSPFNSSSDGSNLNYDGSDNGSRTPGAKWTKSTSAEDYLSANTRFAYQALVVSPNTEYTLEYEYAIKDDDNHAPGGGNRIVGGIMSGHFSDGADILPGNDGVGATRLVSHTGTMNLGKGVFTLVREDFTSNDSGEISLLFYGVTNVDAYVDNVKVYPKK